VLLCFELAQEIRLDDVLNLAEIIYKISSLNMEDPNKTLLDNWSDSDFPMYRDSESNQNSFFDDDWNDVIIDEITINFPPEYF